MEDLQKKEPVREDLDSAKTDRAGLKGFFEIILRKFRMASFIIALVPLYLMSILAMAIAAAPGIYFFNFMSGISLAWGTILHYLSLGLGIVGGYFIYGFCLIFIVPVFNIPFLLKLKPFRGNYYSLSTVPWFLHNALTYIVRYTFLEFFTPTPLNILFYKMMGMKIGKGSHINTTNISDPGLIEIGEKVTIGGSATIIAHYASQGYLVVEPVKIEDRVNIVLKATIMGDVHIGEGVKIAPHEVVMPKSRLTATTRP